MIMQDAMAGDHHSSVKDLMMRFIIILLSFRPPLRETTLPLMRIISDREGRRHIKHTIFSTLFVH